MTVTLSDKPGRTPRPRGRPKADDVAALEARLIQVASELFFRNGYGATAMNAVAAEARVSKTTLWARFPSKADLFRAIVHEQVQRWGSGVNRPPTPRFDTLEETLYAYGDVILYAGMEPEFIQLNRLIYSESERFPELAEVTAGRFELGVRHVAKHIEAFAERDGVPCRDATRAGEFFLVALTGWANMHVLSNRQITPEERGAWLRNTVRMFMGGRSSW